MDLKYELWYAAPLGLVRSINSDRSAELLWDYPLWCLLLCVEKHIFYLYLRVEVEELVTHIMTNADPGASF